MKLTPVSFRRNVPANGARENASSADGLTLLTLASERGGDADIELSIARRFVDARLSARALTAFPGVQPDTLAQAYRIQDAAISLMTRPVLGWKIGRIPDPLQAQLGSHRIAGPIFDVWHVKEGVVEFPVFEGGFAAVEAEFIFRLDRDAPAGKIVWSIDEAAELAGELIVGVEPAGSPLATINALGPTAVASDFGNNAGLILGPPIPGWRAKLDAMTCETFIDGALVGTGGASSIPSGPLESLRFLLENCALRGRPLKAGDLVSTGAATGIHEITAGQSARIIFHGAGEIACRAVPARA